MYNSNNKFDCEQSVLIPSCDQSNISSHGTSNRRKKNDTLFEPRRSQRAKKKKKKKKST